jgi:hypothetical protein
MGIKMMGKNPSGNASAVKVDEDGKIVVILSGRNVANNENVSGLSFELDDDGHPVLRVVDAAPFAYDAVDDVIKINHPSEYAIKDNYGYFDRLSRALELSLGYRSEYYYDSVEYVSFVEGYSKGNPVLTKETDCLKIVATQEEDDGMAEGVYVTNNLVDLSSVNWLYVDWENVGSDNSQVISFLAVGKNKSTAVNLSNDIAIYNLRNFGRKVDRLNVSSLTGEYYIRVHSRDSSSLSQPGRVSDLRVYGIWGMK